MNPAHRVIVNTGVQYIKSIISVIVTLYTARIILSSLGVNDYGIFTLVGGVIGMLAFIQSTLSRTIQRFLNYYQGVGDIEKLTRIFNISIIIHLVIAILLLLTLSLIEPILFNKVLNIAQERISIAETVYFIMLITLFFNIMSTPYLATLISHENIVYTSVVGIVDACLKIPIALSLSTIIGRERLVVYTWMMCGLMGLNFLCYYIYAKRKYIECQKFSIKSFDKRILMEMGGFTGYNIYATFCVVGRSQGLAILLNQFYGTAVNAAYGIGNQIVGQLNFLSTSISTAINPQIIKSEGMGNRERACRLSEISSKFSLLLMSMVLIPIYIYIDTILEFWLKEVPPMTGMFCRYVIIISLLEWSTLSLTALNEALGNIRNFTLIIYTFCLITLPFAWIMLKLNFGAEGLMLSYAIFSIISASARVIYLHYRIGLSIARYLYNVFSTPLLIIAINSVICYLLSLVFTGWWWIVVVGISIMVTMAMSYLIGLNQDEKKIFSQICTKIKSKVKIFNN